MPTMQEIITKADEFRPNRFSTNVKIGWCADVDRAMKNDLLPDADINDDDYEDTQRELLAPQPYSEMYVYYLLAKISYHDDEIDSYNNNMLQYNTIWDEYARFLQRTRPGANLKIKNYM